jgi:transcriptional activator SPT7
MKMGPLGQIIKGGPATSTKKKVKPAAVLKVDGGVAGELGMNVPTEAAPPKKKKGATGVGTGNGRKKKLADAQQGPGQGPPLPPVVVASA